MPNFIRNLPPTPQPPPPPAWGAGGRTLFLGSSDREAVAEYPADQIGIGSEAVKARDVTRLERGPLLGAQLMAGQLLVGEPLPRRVLARDSGQDLVERVRGLR